MSAAAATGRPTPQCVANGATRHATSTACRNPRYGHDAFTKTRYSLEFAPEVGAFMIYRFEDYELDLKKAELRNSGVPVATEPQVLDLLALLAENHDRVLSKDEIVDVVWGGRAISDAAVDSRIRSARMAVADDGQAQRLIRTVRRLSAPRSPRLKPFLPPQLPSPPPQPAPGALICAAGRHRSPSCRFSALATMRAFRPPWRCRTI
ncbi:MAG: winged helix-turn-helix domain-containing protein [Devosia sp.]